MDIVMPRMDGIDATRPLRKALPETKILSLNQHDLPELLNEVEKAGAAAYVSKLLIWDKLVPSLRRVLSETFFCKWFARRHVRCSPSFGPKCSLLKVDRCLQYIIDRSLLLGLWEL